MIINITTANKYLFDIKKITPELDWRIVGSIGGVSIKKNPTFKDIDIFAIMPENEVFRIFGYKLSQMVESALCQYDDIEIEEHDELENYCKNYIREQLNLDKLKNQ